MSNSETERIATLFVMQLEQAAGRRPEDVRHRGVPYDVSSPPRKIEIKAFGGSARGAPIPVEERQVQAARDDPDSYYLYVVDGVDRADHGQMSLRIIPGAALLDMVNRTKPHLTYWPTLRAAEYDAADRLP